MKRMNSKVKAQWLAALRSGEYEQGGGALRQGNSFCCLGVLCDLAAKQGVGNWIPSPDVHGFLTPGDGRASGALPPAVVQWAGLRSNVAHIPGGVRYAIGTRESSTLVLLNDNGYTFAQIADIIEEHF